MPRKTKLLRLEFFPSNVEHVNRCLEAAGVEERLCYNKSGSYFLFQSGDSLEWLSTSVLVTRVGALTVRGWLEEYEQLSGRKVIHIIEAKDNSYSKEQDVSR